MHLPISSWVPPPKPWFRDLSLEAGALQRFASQQVRQIRTWIEVLPIGSSTRYWAGLIGFRAFVWHTEISFLPCSLAHSVALLLLLNDPGVCLVGYFGNQQQVVNGE